MHLSFGSSCDAHVLGLADWILESIWNWAGCLVTMHPVLYLIVGISLFFAATKSLLFLLVHLRESELTLEFHETK